MNSKEYAEKLLQISSPNSEKEEALQFCALGIVGESGEVAELVRKWRYQDQLLDEKNLLLELGDVLWYINRFAIALGKTLEDVMEANIHKLRERYPEGFSAEKSINRKL